MLWLWSSLAQNTHGQNMFNLLMINSCVYALGHSSCLHLLLPVNCACMIINASSITFPLTLYHARTHGT